MTASKATNFGNEVPYSLYDKKNKKTYARMRFFGKGGFAKCYEIVDIKTNSSFACKILSKKQMEKKKRNEKIIEEIQIHSSIKHPNIVQLHGYFEDLNNIYIVLELCKKRSMMELFKRRKLLTAYEVRYYLHQILHGVNYLHDNQIIHRDLKLGNLFLDGNMRVKIGDFGLATRLAFNGECKQNICGTPNYIAPEVLAKKGHSFAVDIWSIGCITYTLLVGRPPFEMKTLDATYSKIKRCDYNLPLHLHDYAVDIIVAMLQLDPEKRPVAEELLKFSFFTKDLVPQQVPSSCQTIVSRVASSVLLPVVQVVHEPLEIVDGVVEEVLLKDSYPEADKSFEQVHLNSIGFVADIKHLYRKLCELLASKPKELGEKLREEHSGPAAQPLIWIAKWLDYTERYGFGYQLSDKSIGVMFNDTTTILLLPNEHDVHYIDADGNEFYMNTDMYDKKLSNKLQLLNLFRQYMHEYLATAGFERMRVESDGVSSVVRIAAWFRTKYCVVMHLTNGSIQFNFSDHQKLLFCPHMDAVTLFFGEKMEHTYNLNTIREYGWPKELQQKVKVKKMMEAVAFLAADQGVSLD